jgi:hypothetical protein
MYAAALQVTLISRIYFPPDNWIIGHGILSLKEKRRKKRK